MSPYYRPKVSGTTRYNVARKNSNYYDQQDSRISGETWRPVDGKAKGKEILNAVRNEKESASLPQPPPPAQPPARTKLSSKSSLFIPGASTAQPTSFESQTPEAAPGWAPPDGRPCGGLAWGSPECLPCGTSGVPCNIAGDPTPGKDCVRDVIFNSLGSELWDLSMVDAQGFSGEWYTNVDVVIPALSASMCHLVASGDTDAIAAAQLATQTAAMKSVCDALSAMAPAVTVTPPEGEALPQLSVEYCAADKAMLCWEYAHHGCCPRGSRCGWAHALLETFMINFLLQPLTNWGTSAETASTCTPSITEASSESSGSHPEKEPVSLPLPSGKQEETRRCCEENVETPTTGVADLQLSKKECKLKETKPLLTPTLRSQNPSRRMWADIEEDSEDEEGFMLPHTWSTPSQVSTQD